MFVVIAGERGYLQKAVNGSSHTEYCSRSFVSVMF